MYSVSGRQVLEQPDDAIVASSTVSTIGGSSGSARRRTRYILGGTRAQSPHKNITVRFPRRLASRPRASSERPPILDPSFQRGSRMCKNFFSFAKKKNKKNSVSREFRRRPVGIILALGPGGGGPASRKPARVARMRRGSFTVCASFEFSLSLSRREKR